MNFGAALKEPEAEALWFYKPSLEEPPLAELCIQTPSGAACQTPPPQPPDFGTRRLHKRDDLNMVYTKCGIECLVFGMKEVVHGIYFLRILHQTMISFLWPQNLEPSIGSLC